MRTWTTAEERAYDSTEPEIDVKVEIADSTDTLRNFCDIDGNGSCLIEMIAWSDSLDAPMATGEATVQWSRTDYDGMSPFVTGGRFEGYLGLWREIVISTKVYPPGAQASDFSWVEVFRGRIDSYDLSSAPGNIQFRDKIGAELMDQQIQSVTEYGDDAGTKDVEDVIQDLLDDHDKTSVTLYTPVASSFQVRAYNQTKMRVLQAAKNLAFTLGWDIRSKWRDTPGEFQLTLYEPDRSNTTADHTIAPGFIRQWGEFGSTVENIRNAVRVWYGAAASDDDDGNDERLSVVRTDETSPAHDLTGSPVANSSIDVHGWRLMEIAEASTSVIQDLASATALADYALSDLADPTLIGRLSMATYFWPVELNDLYDLTADGYRLGADTKAAVFGYAHAIEPGGGARTEIHFRAKPGLGPAAYFSRSGSTILQPDDKAPDAPVVTIRQLPLGVLASVDTTDIRDFDRVLFYVGPRADFLPNADSLVQSSRSTTYVHTLSTGIRREFLKVQIRDLVGNISTTSAAIPLVGKKADQRQLSQTVQAKTQVGLYADATLTGYGVVKFTKYDAGEFLGDYNIQTGRFVAREGGTYRVAMSAKISTSMAEGTDFYVCVMRDPDGDDDEVARSIVTAAGSGDDLVTLEAFIPLDAQDEFQLEVCDAGGSFANITFRATYTTVKVELVGTQQRSRPYPFVEADPVFLDHGPSGNYSSAAGECHAVFRLSTGEVLFANGAPGAAHPATLHRNEVDVNKARSITDVASSTDYWFGGAAELADRSVILCANKEDSTVHYAIRKYEAGTLTNVETSSTLGATIEPRCVCHADNVVTDNPIYVGSVEPSGVGKVRSYAGSTLVAIAASSDLGAGVNSLAHLNPQEATGGIVCAMLSDATSPDIVALDASDVTASEIWRIQLDGLATAGTSDDACELKTSPEGDVLYAIGGTTNPTVYAISPTGDVVWSEDLGDHSELADITGCLSLDVHPTTGDVAVLCYYADTATEIDCVTFDPDGNYRWSWRALGELDPDDDPDWTSDTTGHRIAFATDGAIWVSGGGSSTAKAKIIRPFSEIPDEPPGIASNALIADFDAEKLDLADGAAVSNWTASKERRSKTLADGRWRLQNSTTAEQPTFRGRWRPATVDSVSRTQTRFAAVEFDGTARLIGNIESTILADGAVCVLVCEPVDATGDYFSAYEDAGSAAAPLLELENASGRLTFRVNVDGSQDTDWAHGSRAGLQVVGCHSASLTEAGIWLNNAQPNQTAANAGTDATPDGDPRIRLGQAGSSSGDWFAGWVYRWLWLKPSEFSAGRVTSVVHWARQYYGIPELAVEEPATAGDPADLAGPTQYITSGTQQIDRMNAIYLSGECLIAAGAEQGAQPPLYSIPDDGTAANWAVSTASPLGTSSHPVSGIAIDSAGEYAYISVEGDGTGNTAALRYGLMRVVIATGAIDYFTASDADGESGSTPCHDVVLDETNGHVYLAVTDGGDEVRQHTAATGAAESVTLNDSSLGTVGALCMSPDDGYIIGCGDAEYIGYWATSGLSGKGNGIDDTRTNFDGTDTTAGFNSFERNVGAGRVLPCRDGSNKVWFCAGDSTSDDPYIMRYDPDEAVAVNRVDLEVDVSGDMNPTDTGTAHVRDIAVDKDGLVYALVMPGSSSVDYDIVRYLPDGTFDLSFDAEGVTIMDNATYGDATRLAVDEDYNVYVGTVDGYVIVYSQ